MKRWTPKEIKAFRQRLTLYQKDFAAMLRVTEQYVCNLEKGVRTPSKTMEALLDCLEQEENKKDGGKKKMKTQEDTKAMSDTAHFKQISSKLKSLRKQGKTEEAKELEKTIDIEMQRLQKNMKQMMVRLERLSRS